MTYAIVAIPSKDDPVWQISSEKVPHLTIMILGENLPNLTHTLDFLGHVVNTSLCRFGLNVDRRDVLGPKEADVLFFGEYGIEKLKSARANLLRNKDIFLAYNSTEQFPKWIPHLTMGYPETPAKPTNREYPISWVNFDRIALWTEDYEGPEFELRNEPYFEIAMGSMAVENVLSHFGVKGMKWGVRREGYKRIAAYSNYVRNPNTYALREISKEEYDSLPSAPIKLGTEFGRTAFGGAAHIRDDLVYVTKTETDAIRYMALNGPTGHNKVRREQLKIKTDKEVVSPGLKERIDTLSDVIGKRITDPTTGRTSTARADLIEMDPTLAALNNRELGRKFYQSFAQSQHSNTLLHSVYFDELKKKGYNAVVDDADRGSLSDLPIILFPKESGAKVSEVKAVTYKEVLEARARLEIPDQKLVGKIGV